MKLFAEKRRSFPDPRHTLFEGILDVNDDVSVERLLEAYSFGIFPWPHEGYPTLWFSPEQRGVLDFADFHISRSLQKFCRTADLKVSLNCAFEDVIRACSEVPRSTQHGTWITPQLLNAYVAFHKLGYAHSLEVWEREALVGGIYGVYVAGVFCGESMFFRKSNASKLALVRMVEFLRGQGLTWMDTQMVTPALEDFGGKYISRDVFLDRLEAAKSAAKPIHFSL